MIKYKGAILARLMLRFKKTWIVTYRWTVFGLHGVFKYLHFPQDSHNPFHSCGCCLGCAGARYGSPDGVTWAGALGNFRELDTRASSALGFLLQPVLKNARVERASHPDYKSFTTSRSKWEVPSSKGEQPACGSSTHSAGAPSVPMSQFSH